MYLRVTGWATGHPNFKKSDSMQLCHKSITKFGNVLMHIAAMNSTAEVDRPVWLR